MTDLYLRVGELLRNDLRLRPTGPDTAGGVTYFRTLTDAAPASDLLARRVTTARTTTDTAPASDTVSRTILVSRFLVDHAPAIDAVTRTLILARALNDTARASDAVSAVVTYYVAPTKARLCVAHDLVTRLAVEVTTCPV